MIIFSVSPGYLNYMHKESLPYEFKFQGYGNLSDALIGLSKTNPSQIYGFSVVVDSIPEKTGLLSNFIKTCDLISEKSKKRKRFVLAVQNPAGVDKLVSSIKIKNLDMFVPKYEIMNDLFIRREIFGTILSGYLNPYFVDEQKDVPDISNFKPARNLSYTPLFSPVDMKSLYETRNKDTQSEVITEDPYLDELKKTSEFHFRLRIFGIKRKFDPNTVPDHFLEDFINKQTDLTVKTHYNMLYSYVKEFGLDYVEDHKKF